MAEPEGSETARRLGVEYDAGEARRWILAVGSVDEADGIAADEHVGVFGDRPERLLGDARVRSLVDALATA